jgi:hypothetical protein
MKDLTPYAITTFEVAMVITGSYVIWVVGKGPVLTFIHAMKEYKKKDPE